MQMLMLDCITARRMIHILSTGTRSEWEWKKSDYLMPRSAIDHCNLINHFLKHSFTDNKNSLTCFSLIPCVWFIYSTTLVLIHVCCLIVCKIKSRLGESHFLTNDPRVGFSDGQLARQTVVFAQLLFVFSTLLSAHTADILKSHP